MFGASFLELLFFVQQLGLAIAGAAALWGFVFIYKGQHHHHGDECVVFDWLAQKLLWLLLGGAALSVGSWMLLTLQLPAHAHEGIVLVPTIAERIAAYDLTFWVYIVWFLLLFPLGLLSRQITPMQFHRRLATYYAIHFIFITFLISLPAWTHTFSFEQLFFAGHSFHSILTVGTVVVLDFLFLVSKTSLFLKQHIYPFFPTISKVILIGLGIEFLSVLAVFPDAIALTPKFFFMQTVIGILLINGSILAGPLTRRMLDALQKGSGILTRRWELVGDIAGTISIGSWFTVTFVDYFAELSVGYLELLGSYAAILLVAILVHVAWVRLRHDDVSEQLRTWHRA